MLSAQKMIELKSEVKALMQERTGYGSLASYGESTWDFTTTPTADQPIKLEHGRKTVNLVLNINDYPGLTALSMAKGQRLPTALNEDFLNYVKSLRGKSLPDGEMDCNAYCTGLCTTQCVGGCRDTCTGTCNTECTNTCTGQSYVAPHSNYYYDVPFYNETASSFFNRDAPFTQSSFWADGNL